MREIKPRGNDRLDEVNITCQIQRKIDPDCVGSSSVAFQDHSRLGKE